MTRLFLAAGVAALAISAPLAAKPGGGHGGGNGGQAAEAHGKGGGGQRAKADQRGGGGSAAMRAEHGGAFAAQRQERQQRFSAQRQEHQQFRANRVQQARNRGFERQQVRAQRVEQARNERQVRGQRFEQTRNRGFERQQLRDRRVEQARDERQLRSQRFEQAQNRAVERKQLRGQRIEEARNRAFERREFEQRSFARRELEQRSFARREFNSNRYERERNRYAARNWDRDFRVNEDFERRYYRAANTRGFIEGCPPGLWAKNNGCLPPGQARKLLGAPLSRAASFAALRALPRSVSYLYPETPDYYYRYGNGYLYQVDRRSNLIANLLPLLAGGYMPGQYLPQPYMASYVPNNYGFNSFYPDYGNTCNRYANGVIYQVDCYSGMVENVIPTYAGGYGVGQLLPSSSAYYNVPYQYRDLYYDTADSGYWYAPGAIYQYDRGSSMITSVAALLSPGFGVGQQLPVGYDVYNVPYSYRSTYYDTPDAWYRYNNGNIYQVDPVTRLVTAIVASILT